jgi:hypothetical protein
MCEMVAGEVHSAPPRPGALPLRMPQRHGRSTTTVMAPSFFATSMAGRSTAHTHGLAGSRTSDETCRCGLAGGGEGGAAARRRSARRGKAWRDAEQVAV